MSGQIAHYLRTAELYDKVLNLIAEDTYDEVGGRGVVKGILDAILTQGKIEGRETALDQITPVPEQGETWLSRDGQDIAVEIRSVSPAQIVHYASPACPCSKEWHAAGGHDWQMPVERFVRQYRPSVRTDRLIEDWQNIVGSV